MICISDMERQSRLLLPKSYADYFSGGAEDETTLEANTQSFKQIYILPRVLRGKFEGSLHTQLLGAELDYPILAAPTAFHKLVNEAGELATAKALAAKNSLMIVSMASNTAIEDIIDAGVAENPDFKAWMQLYIQPDRGFTQDFIKRAEQAGCRALVVTVDSPVFGRRIRDLRNSFNELPDGLDCPNMRDAQGKIRNIAFDSQLCWADIAWLREQTSLPIVLKGILHPDDVQLAIEYSVQAVIVSNHGGRQLEGAPATIRMLPALVNSAQGRIPLILDGGVRSGMDVFKALAMGATAVAIGRPVIWGLSIDGQKGVEQVVDLLASQLLTTAQLSGCRTRDDIKASLLLEDRYGGSLL